MKLVYILWEDAHGPEGWQSPEAVTRKPLLVESVGFLAHDGKKTKTLYPSYTGNVNKATNPLCLSALTIPCGCIRKIKKLKY
jgi:hypothetical protein